MKEENTHLIEKHQFTPACSGYGVGPPWHFNGRAFYQLHLVKANVARRFIPSDLKLVEAFGYTLGGIYLAQYDGSPAGAFDELVIIAGTVWNPPTSCAWAARVLVNNLEARDHGRKEIGLPSHIARFSLVAKSFQQKQQRPWWNPFRFWPGQAGWQSKNSKQCEIDVIELEGSSTKPLCQMLFPSNWARSEARRKWDGPSVSMSLPSFSGRTQGQPQLLKYSCQLNCSVKAVKPAIVTTPLVEEGSEVGGGDLLYDSVLSLLAAKPLLALCFENMSMDVEAATVVAPNSKDKEPHKFTPEINGNFAFSVKSS